MFHFKVEEERSLRATFFSRKDLNTAVLKNLELQPITWSVFRSCGIIIALNAKKINKNPDMRFHFSVRRPSYLLLSHSGLQGGTSLCSCPWMRYITSQVNHIARLKIMTSFFHMMTLKLPLHFKSTKERVMTPCSNLGIDYFSRRDHTWH